MSIIEMIFLSFALAMDCFAISLASGVILMRPHWGVVFSMSFLFGLFQAMMPFAGWLVASSFASYIEAFDHWIAFAMLALIGGKMIKESFLPEEERHFNPVKFHTQIVLAVATSIDALAVGISFACVGYSTVSSLLLPLSVIGVGSFLFGVLGNIFGVVFGNGIGHRVRPGLIGGVILIVIGCKILASHLFGW